VFVDSDGRRYATTSQTAALYGVTPARVQWLVRHGKLTRIQDPDLLRKLKPHRVGKPPTYLLDLGEVHEKAIELRLTVHDEEARSEPLRATPAEMRVDESGGSPSGEDLSHRLSRIEQKLDRLADSRLSNARAAREVSGCGAAAAADHRATASCRGSARRGRSAQDPGLRRSLRSSRRAGRRGRLGVPTCRCRRDRERRRR
jgi:hypothetical protein